MIKQLLRWMTPHQVLRLVWEWGLGLDEPALQAALAQVYAKMSVDAIAAVIAEKEAAVTALRAGNFQAAAEQQVKEWEGIRW